METLTNRFVWDLAELVYNFSVCNYLLGVRMKKRK